MSPFIHSFIHSRMESSPAALYYSIKMSASSLQELTLTVLFRVTLSFLNFKMENRKRFKKNYPYFSIFEIT
jgi:hypothetical protein